MSFCQIEKRVEQSRHFFRPNHMHHYRHTTRLFILGTLLLFTSVTLAKKGPWQRRIGKQVEIHHKRQHERVSPSMWPKEPDGPASPEITQFANALATLCGEDRLPQQRRLRFATAIIEESAAFQQDPFLIGALIFDQSRCLPKQPDSEIRYGLSRIDVKMHAPHIRHGAYQYYINTDSGWTAQSLKMDKYPFNQWKAAAPKSNIYFTAALLRVFDLQHRSLDQAFPSVPHRHYLSHFFFGDKVNSSEPEDRVLTTRRVLIDLYLNKKTSPASTYNGDQLYAPLLGTPRVVLDNFGHWRGDRKSGHQHQGLDIVAEQDEPVFAVADGRVIFVGVDLPQAGSQLLETESTNQFPTNKMGAGGRYIAIRHPSNLRTYYMHLETVAVTHRQTIKAGDFIGTIGHTGTTQSGPHLHLEFRLPNKRLDPAISLAPVLVDPTGPTAPPTAQ